MAHPTRNPLRTVASVYRIVCTVDNRLYIGSSGRTARRFSDHRSKLNRNCHENPNLQASWNEHGDSAHSFELVELVDDVEQLAAREQSWIDKYAPGMLLNRSPTAGHANTGIRRTEEQRAARRGEKNPNAVLSAADVDVIRRTLVERAGARGIRSALARRYGIHTGTITKIERRQLWA
jgi:group I intron endonuclease